MADVLARSLMLPHSGILVVFTLAIHLLQLLGGAESANVGVCYGMIANNLPPSSEVVTMYKTNNINKMRLFFPNSIVSDSLRGSGIDVILDVPRENLQTLASNAAAAAGWVRDNVLKFYPAVQFRYIAVGNERIPSQEMDFIFPAMKNVHSALVSAGVSNQIKVSTVVHMAVLDANKSFLPSSGTFDVTVESTMRKITNFLKTNNAPLMANVYPYFAYAGQPNQIKQEYALFTLPRDEVHDPSSNLSYQNLFDAMLDTIYAALEKVAAGGLEVVVTESGWPSAGSPQASVDNARTYNNNFAQHIGSGKGTPKRPGKKLEAYIFAMFNENQKTPPGIENNFGLFFPNKQPIYPMQF